MITSKLSFAQRQLVELAKVLTLEERVEGDLVILLDEPTSVLAEEEVELLFELVRELTSAGLLHLRLAPHGRGDGAVRPHLRDEGRRRSSTWCRATAPTSRRSSTRWSAAMSTRNTTANSASSPMTAHARCLSRCEDVGLPGRIKDISLTLHAGEVLCLVGVEGSGREAILRTIFGLRTPDTGHARRSRARRSQLQFSPQRRGAGRRLCARASARSRASSPA